MSALTIIILSVITSIATLIIISLGLAVIFGLMGIVNMAHGEFIMLGAFTTITCVLRANLPLWVGMIAAPLVGFFVGLVIEVALIRPLYGKRLTDTLLVTFGLSLVLFQVAVDIFGTTSPGVATPMGALTIGQYSTSIYSAVFLPLMTVAIVGAVYYIFKRTRYGLLARAVAQNANMANSLGVNANRVHGLTFALGCAIAGFGGALIAPIAAVSPGMGQSYVAQAFLTVVTGGPAFLAGTTVASVLLGAIDEVVSQLFTTLWGITALMLSALLIIRLLPSGISGRWRNSL